MCGIVGCFGNFDSHDADLLGEMLESLAHRGPDMSNLQLIQFSSGRTCGLGSTRLAIQDLSTKSLMPMESSDGRYVMCFNGEIYNFKELRQNLEGEGHSFFSSGDTEVLLKMFELKGLSTLDSLNEMFTIALFDRVEEKLYLIRDRLGVKPLYFHRADNKFFFSSEIKILLSNPTPEFKLDKSSITQFFKYGFIASPKSIIEKIYKVEPGTIVEISKDLNVTKSRWWSIASQTENHNEHNQTKNQKLKTFGELLQDACALRMISDVPVGIFQSSGIDSSLISIICSEELDFSLNSFTVAFPNPRDSRIHNEGSEAAIFARGINQRHEIISINKETVLSEIERVIYSCDEPVGESIAIAYYELSKMSKNSCTVVISGEGADEAFGGYTYYRLELIRRLMYLMPRFLRHFLDKRIDMKESISYRDKAFQAVMQDSSIELWEKWNSFFTEDQLEKLLIRKSDGQFMSSAIQEIYSGDESFLQKNATMLCDLHLRLPDYLLHVRDRMTMANSQELRSPFLDYRLVEFAFRLKQREKLDLVHSKKIFYDFLAFRGYDRFWRPRKKVAFQSPVIDWIPALEEKYLDQPLMVKSGIVDGDYLARLLKKRGSKFEQARILNLIFFEIWLTQYEKYLKLN